MIKRVIVCVLLLTMLLPLGNKAAASHASTTYFSGLEETKAFLYGEGAELIPHNFIWPEHLSFLGELDYFDGWGLPDSGYQYGYTFTFSAGQRRIIVYVNPTKGLEFTDGTPLDNTNFDGYADVYLGEMEGKYTFQRDELTFHYLGEILHVISWRQNGMYLDIYDCDGFSHDVYEGTLVGQLMSMDDAVFQEAKAQLLSIDNTPKHIYSEEWQIDGAGHWHECKCGEKEEVFAHVDEDQNNKCDVCSYNIPKNSSNRPAITPAQPDDNAAQPTTPTVPATQPTSVPQEPTPPATGLWIGIGAGCAVVVAAVVVILLRKKKSA